MSKYRLYIYIAAGIILIAAVLTLPFQVGQARGERLSQTWPSRTPTPQGGPNPTDTSEPPPQPTDDPGNPPQNTATPQPGSTNTPVPGEPSPTSTTASATIAVETPEGGYAATAEPCGVPPTVQARGLVNVRLGPGLDYEPIDSLVYLEVRSIVGRAEFATWWLIQLPGNDTGWVADQAVAVQGYTGGVPIVEPPDLNGATPTPGPLWEPTPNPNCTPVPTSTPTNTPEVEEEEAAASTVSAVSNTTATEAPPEPTDTEEPTEEPPTDTPEPEPTTAPATPTTAPTIDAGSSDTEASTQGDSDGSTTSPSTWILLIGVGLVIVGAVSFVIRSR